MSADNNNNSGGSGAKRGRGRGARVDADRGPAKRQDLREANNEGEDSEDIRVRLAAMEQEIATLRGERPVGEAVNGRNGQNGQIDGVARGADNQAQPSAAQIVSAITDVAKTQKIDMAVARHTETLKTVGIVDFSVNDTFASALEKINVLSAVLKHEHEPEVARIVLERALNTTVFMKLSRRMERANGSWTASGVFEAGDWRTILVEQNVLDHTVPWCKDTPKIDFSKSYATYHVGVRPCEISVNTPSLAQ
jgi:hypothetical protein